MQVWAYEVLGMYPSANNHENEEVIPEQQSGTESTVVVVYMEGE